MNYLIYQLKVAAVLLIFYGIYKLILANNIFFKTKRYFILGLLSVAWFVPLIKIQVTSEFVTYYQNLPAVIVGSDPVTKETAFNFDNLLIYIYLFVLSVLVLSFLTHITQILNLVKASAVIKYSEFSLVETSDIEAFTFFRYVFLGKKIPEENRSLILKHEAVHAQKLHSLDLLIIELITFFQWFNPAVWLFRKEMKKNHEYETDRTLLDQGVSVETYQTLLLNEFFNTRGIRFSYFNYNSLIKNRIKMMANTNTRAGKTRFLLATVLGLLIVSVFSFKTEPLSKLEAAIQEIQDVQPHLQPVIRKDTLKKSKQEEALLVPDSPATYQGKGLTEFSNYVMTNIVYPIEAVKNKWEGKVYVTFIVEKDGTIQEAKILRGSYKVLDEEAIRIIKQSPAWTPAQNKGQNVRQMFTLPIIFKLQ